MTWLPLNPIPLKDRVSMIFLQYGQIDVIDGAFVLIDKTGIRTHIPVGSVACIMLEPGTLIITPAAGYSPAATSSPANPFSRYKAVLVTTDYPPVLLCLSWSSPPGEIRHRLQPSRLCH